MSDRKQRPAPAFPWLKASQVFYEQAFGVRTSQDMAEAMAEFGQMTDAERQYIQCHLLWMQLQAFGSLRGQAQRAVNGIGDLVSLAQDVEFGEEPPIDITAPHEPDEVEPPEVEAEVIDPPGAAQ